MQCKDEKTVYLAKTVGKIVKSYRLKNNDYTINRFAHEYDLDVGNVSRIENGLIDCKLVTLWKISEALGIKLSCLIQNIEKDIGDDFFFFDE